MDILLGAGYWILISIIVLGVAILGIYLKKKFNIKDEEIDLGKKLIGLLVYIAKNSKIKYSGNIDIVAKYVIDAIDFVDEYEDAGTIEGKKDLVSEKALAICRENGIKVDPELVNLVDDIVDYFIQ